MAISCRTAYRSSTSVTWAENYDSFVVNVLPEKNCCDNDTEISPLPFFDTAGGL